MPERPPAGETVGPGLFSQYPWESVISAEDQMDLRPPKSALELTYHYQYLGLILDMTLSKHSPCITSKTRLALVCWISSLALELGKIFLLISLRWLTIDTSLPG